MVGLATVVVREAPLRDVLAALADNTRLRILHQLRIRHEHCQDLEGCAGIHVTVHRSGSRSYYRRDEAAIERVTDLLATL